MKIIADMNIPFAKECFSSIGDVTLVGGRDVTAEVVKDADILLVRSITKVNEELLGGSSVKFVAVKETKYPSWLKGPKTNKSSSLEERRVCETPIWY